jgi:hypothetical protein
VAGRGTLRPTRKAHAVAAGRLAELPEETSWQQPEPTSTSLARSPTVSGLAGSVLELLVYANCPLEHRVGLLTLVANGLEHACGQRIELALNGRLGP